MIIHPRIRKAIAAQQTTQKEIAMRLGISEQYLSDIVNGKRGVSAFVAVRMERVLKLDAHKLLIDQALDELRQAREAYKPEPIAPRP